MRFILLTFTLILSSCIGIGSIRSICGDVNCNPVQGEIQIGHAGWTLIKALGPESPEAHTGLSSKSASVTLSWATVVSNGSVTFNVYRSTTSGGQDFSSPIASGLTASSYTDESVSSEQTYYYTVRAVLNGQVIVPESTYADSEVKVIVPPAHMALIHRWSANKEMCELMGRTPDRNNNYRCSYTGPGGDGTHFDLGRSIFMDVYEVGCNYTSTAGACGNAYGCLGTGVPSNAIGNNGEVFFDRLNSGRCYLKSAGTWRVTNSGSLAAPERAQRASNAPGLPPISRLSQVQSQEICSNMNAGTFGNKRLASRKEFILASAWPDNLQQSEILNLELGADLSVTSGCNGSTGAGLSFDATVPPVNIETLPSLASSGANGMLVRTGSISTRSCISRYGVRDLIGNLAEWVSDQMDCSSVTNICNGQTSTVVPSNTDFSSYSLNGVDGPGGQVLGTWAISDMTYSSTKFLLPIGMPVVTGSTLDALSIGTGTGEIDPATFLSDRLILSQTTAIRGFQVGGRWNTGNSAGRFYTEFRNYTETSSSAVGLRCAVDAE